MTWAAAAGTKKRDQDGGKCAEGRKKNDAFLCGDIPHSGVVTSDTEEEKLSYGDGPPGGVSERPFSREPPQQENFRRTVTTMHGFLHLTF